MSVGKLFCFEVANQGPKGFNAELADIHMTIIKAFSVL
ncbi:hypothetical protein J2X88_005055 [Pseudomonas extremaustralis]|nr:hypothetical protein [Pseudomonas extremaustralis]